MSYDYDRGKADGQHDWDLGLPYEVLKTRSDDYVRGYDDGYYKEDE